MERDISNPLLFLFLLFATLLFTTKKSKLGKLGTVYLTYSLVLYRKGYGVIVVTQGATPTPNSAMVPWEPL